MTALPNNVSPSRARPFPLASTRSLSTWDTAGLDWVHQVGSRPSSSPLTIYSTRSAMACCIHSLTSSDSSSSVGVWAPSSVFAVEITPSRAHLIILLRLLVKWPKFRQAFWFRTCAGISVFVAVPGFNLPFSDSNRNIYFWLFPFFN